MEALEIILCVLLTLNGGATAALYVLLSRYGKHAVDSVGGRQEIDAAPEAAEKKDPLDEGFDNIMRYEVRGRTGFEADE